MDVRHSEAWGMRTPKTSGTAGRATALTSDARESVYCERAQSLFVQREQAFLDLFGNPSAKLPADACLHGENYIVHFYLACASGIFCVHIRVGQNMCGVSVRKVEKLVEDGWLDVLDGGRGGEEEGDGACGGRKIIWAGHELSSAEGVRGTVYLCLARALRADTVMTTKAGRCACIFLPPMFRSAVTKTVLSAARPAASRALQRPLLARAYHEKVISHYEQPRNVWTHFCPI